MTPVGHGGPAHLLLRNWLRLSMIAAIQMAFGSVCETGKNVKPASLLHSSLRARSVSPALSPRPFRSRVSVGLLPETLSRDLSLIPISVYSLVLLALLVIDIDIE